MAAHSGRFAGFRRQADLLDDEMCRVERDYKYLGLQFHCTSIRARDTRPDNDKELFREFDVNYQRDSGRVDLPWTMDQIQNLTDLLKETSDKIDSRGPNLVREITRNLDASRRTIALFENKLNELRNAVTELIADEITVADVAAVTQDPTFDPNGELRYTAGEARAYWARPSIERIDDITDPQGARFAPWMMEMKEIKIAQARGLVTDAGDVLTYFLTEGPMLAMPERATRQRGETLNNEGGPGQGTDPEPVSGSEPGTAAELELGTRFGPGAAFRFA